MKKKKQFGKILCTAIQKKPFGAFLKDLKQKGVLFINFHTRFSYSQKNR